MDSDTADLGSPLLADEDGDEFYDANFSATASMMMAPMQLQSLLESPGTAAANDKRSNAATTMSFYGKVSPLSTGMLFPSVRGIVDALPHPELPCLLFADHDPLAAVSHICLMEKEVDSITASGGTASMPLKPKLFTVAHVCQPLESRGDEGSRLLKKIGKNHALRLPVLLHEENIFQESTDDSGLLPEYIDRAIGKKNLLIPNDDVGLFNMKLVSFAAHLLKHCID